MSFSFKNFSATSFVILLCALLLVLSFFGTAREYVVSSYKENMVISAKDIAGAASSFAQNDSLNNWTLAMTISSVSASTGNKCLVMDGKGTVVCCSDKKPLCEHIGITVPQVLLEYINKEGIFRGTSSLGGIYSDDVYVVGVPVVNSQENVIIGYVFESVNQERMFGDYPMFLLMGVAITFVIVSVFLVGIYLYFKKVSKPLDEIAAVSRKFARGDFSSRVHQIESPDNEMGMLIESFNTMADSLEQAEIRRSDFIANVSHELRTPMTTIAGFADGILDGTIPKEEENKYLVSIRDETRRLARLVREMLDVSQTKAQVSDYSSRTVFDITELVVQTLLSFEDRAMKKHLDVDPQLPDNHLLVRADKDAITRVIYNLLDNAVKFADFRSCLILRLYKDNGKAYVSVADRGQTIPAEDLPFIFDRFHKSDKSRSIDKDGVGLGLYFVKEIINAHDEDIAVKSENGLTEFVFTLPLAD